MTTLTMASESSPMHLSIVRRAALALVAVGLVLGTGASPAAAADTGLSFDTQLYQSCALVYGPPTGLGSVSQLTAGGSVLETQEVSLDGSGTGQACFDDVFSPGMRIRGVTGGVTRTLTIPLLTLNADRTTDVVSGKAPAGSHVTLTVSHRPTLTTFKDYQFTRTASSTGSWAADTTSTFNLIGADQLAVAWSNGRDTATLRSTVPNLTVRIGSSHMSGYLLIGQAGTVTLRTSTGTKRASAYLAGTSWATTGYPENVFTSSTGSPVAVRIGDKVSAPFQPSMAFTVPNLTVSVDTATDVVSGACPASRRLMVKVQSLSTFFVAGTCSSAGTYSIDTTATVDLVSGARVTTRVRLSAGDNVDRLKVVP